MAFSTENVKRVVIKLGTGILTNGSGDLNSEKVHNICKQVTKLQNKSIEVIVVSSGSIGVGMGQLKLAKRPTDLSTLQACAAVGQTLLINIWREGFATGNINVAQILLTHGDICGEHRHIAVKNTIDRLLSLGIVPVINENDTVSTDEITFGDNDILAALTAKLVEADYLIILSTISGLLDLSDNNKLISKVEKITPEIEQLAEDIKNEYSVGGMKSKIEAAKIAVSAGCKVFIGSGADPTIISQVLDGSAVGTFFELE